MAVLHRPLGTGRAAAALAVAVAGVLTGCSLFDAGPERDSETGALLEAVEINVFDLAVGDCLDGFADGEAVSQILATPCDEEHTHEVFASLTLPDGDYPGQEDVDEQARAGCVEQFAVFVGRPWDNSTLDYGYYTPTRQSWETGDREVLCMISDPSGPITGTLEGTDR